MMRLPFFLFGLMFACGAAQAGELDEAFKALLKERLGGKNSEQALATPPQQPSQPVPPTAPTQPAAPAQPAAQPAQKPQGQLLQALLAGKTSQAEEVRIGQQIAGNLLGTAPLVRDEALQRYVNRVGRWVSLQSERPGLPWRFGVIESEDINAFAAPGGYIFLTKGLYRQLDNEAQLAGVLAHEIGHVIRKHHLKLLQKTQLVAGLGALFGGKVGNENQLVQNLIGNGAEIVARGLDKDAEYEADRIGVVLTARAGYDAYALPAVLAEIGHVAKGDKRVSLLFKTHPHPEERLGRLAESVGSHLDGVPEGQSLANRFHRLR
ncbi:MAG: M48 family metalloprotease [Pseudomonadota bacterium]